MKSASIFLVAVLLIQFSYVPAAAQQDGVLDFDEHFSSCAILGLLAGASAGALLFDLTETRTYNIFGYHGNTRFGQARETSLSKRGLARLLLLGSAGTLMGMVIGTNIENESWKQVVLPDRIGMRPQRNGGLTLSASFAF